MGLLGSLGTLNVLLSADTGKFIGALDRAAFEAEKRMGKIAAQGKLNSLLWAASWTAAATAVSATFLKFADNAAMLDKLTQKTGISVESLSKLQYAAKMTDVEFSTLTSGINILNKKIAEGDNIFAKLGIRVQDSAGHLRSTEDVVRDIAELFSKYKDGAGKAAAAQLLFGKSGADIIPYLDQGKKGIDDAGKAAEHFGDVVTKEAAAGATEFKDRLTEVQNKIDGLVVKLGTPTLTVINKFWDALGGTYQALTHPKSSFIDNLLDDSKSASDVVDGIYNDVFENQEKVNKTIADTGTTLQKIVVTADKAQESLKQWDIPLSQIHIHLKTITEDTESIGYRLNQIAQEIGISFTNSFDDAIIEGTKLGQVMENLAKDIERSILHNLISAPLGNSLSNILQSVLNPNNLSKQVSAFNGGVHPYPAPNVSVFTSPKGNIFSGHIKPFAMGGIFNGPTLFPLANGTGLAGEAGKEAILPLTRTPGGDLGVKSVGNSGKVEVNIYAPPGSQVSQDSQTDSGGMERINIYIDEATSKNLSNPGSKTFKAMRNTFGASQTLNKR